MELFRFLKWQWNKFDLWQKWYLTGAAFFGAGITASENVRYYLLAVPVGIALYYIGKCVIYDSIVESYQKYKQEKQSLFETIKTSHER